MAALLIGAWIITGAVVLAATPFPDRGPGDLAHATSKVPRPIYVVGHEAGVGLEEPVVGAYVAEAPGGPLWVLYSIDKTDRSVMAAVAVDARTYDRVQASWRLIPTGAWKDLGFIKSPGEWALGGVALLAVLTGFGVWGAGLAARTVLARRRVPASPWLRVVTHPIFVAFLLAGGIGFVVLPFLRPWTRALKVQMAFRAALGWSAFAGAFAVAGAYPEGDLPSVTGVSFILGATALAWAFAWVVLRPAGQRHLLALARLPRDTDLGEMTARAQVEAAAAEERDRLRLARGRGRRIVGGLAGRSGARTITAPGGPMLVGELPKSDRSGVRVQTPDQLPDWSDVGGMAQLKRDIAASVGRLLAFPAEAEELGVAFGGLLLFGPAGTGKTFIARAVAGEYGLNLIAVSAADLSSSLRGEESRNVRSLFRVARENGPCVLFFDEFDAIARRRDDGGLSGEDRTTLSVLLGELEAIRDRRDVIVVAATNDVHAVDPAAIRPGRFDRQIRVDLPDREARREIFRTCLADRHRVAADVDLEILAESSTGMTPAAIARAVRRAATMVLDAIAGGDTLREITQADLIDALHGGAGRDRPTVEEWSWDRLVLDERTKAELRQMQALIEHPETATRMGLQPLTGLLLYGPAGTGKTTVARVLAAEAQCNFYPLRGSDLVSKWVGDTERNIADAFQRAADNAPAIVFIDELDALAPQRGVGVGVSYMDRAVNQLLQEIDGLHSRPGVFVLAATNRPDVLDPALRRGGRLSREIEIGMPGPSERETLLRRHTARMPLAGDVDIVQLAALTEGWSGADLAALCQQAGMVALLRTEGGMQTAAVEMADFHEALTEVAGHR